MSWLRMAFIGLGSLGAVMAAVMITPEVAFSGALEPASPPGPTMHTLEDIYNKLQTMGNATASATMPSIGDVRGSSSIHMLVEGPSGIIQGECTVEGREDTIPLLLFSHEVVSPRDAASGLPTGSAQHQPVVILKYVDQSSPLLYQMQVGGSVLPHVTLRFYRIGAHEGEEVNYYTITLDDAIIVCVKSSIPHMEEVAFVYDCITWRYEEGGVESQANWDGTPVKKASGEEKAVSKSR